MGQGENQQYDIHLHTVMNTPSINKHTLPNGLRIVHIKDTSTQMATMNILYNVGSKHEHPDKTGFAHLFEHLMFGGSQNIPDYDSPLQLASGTNNAYTTADYTNYYLTLPACNIETAFWLESDRMASLAFTPESLEVQRKVVMEEFKQHYITPPYGDIAHLINALAYQRHHYSWPTIGKELSHIANVSMEEVKDFFFRFYAPNNAVISIVGNIEMDEVVRLATQWFGPIPRRLTDTTSSPQEPLQTERRCLKVNRPVPGSVLYMAFHIAGMMDTRFHACDMISDILSAGRSCRLNHHLVEQQHIFTSIDAYIQPRIDTGLLFICGMPSEGVSLEEAEESVWREVDLLLRDGITDDELAKVKNKFETTRSTELLNRQKLAANLAFYENFASAERTFNETSLYLSTTRQQFMDVCSEVMKREKANVLQYEAENI